MLTGATGFVGANLARRLLADGHEVHLLLREKHSKWRIEEIARDVQSHVVDLRDLDMVRTVVTETNPEWIFHLAAHGAYSWQNDVHEIVQTNLVSTVNLLDACLQNGFQSFVNTGSSSEYGLKDHAPKEDEAVEPNSYYAVTKVSATMHCRYVARSQQQNIPTLRLYSVFGAYEEPNRLMPTIIIKGLTGAYPPLVNPDVARDYVYIDDVCDAYIMAAEKKLSEPGAILNVGSAVQTSLREVAEVARKLFNIEAEPQWGSMPNRSWDTNIWVSDNSKIKSALGWQPKDTFESGFAKMVEWFRQNEETANWYQGQIC
jgi:nucleoside-diphosphate-sugar epimerase